MTEFFAAVGGLFEIAWNVLTGVTYPGTTLTIAAILIGAFCAVASLRVIGFVMGARYDLGSSDASGGNNKKIKISSNRQGDTVSTWLDD